MRLSSCVCPSARVHFLVRLPLFLHCGRGLFEATSLEIPLAPSACGVLVPWAAAAVHSGSDLQVLGICSEVLPNMVRDPADGTGVPRSQLIEAWHGHHGVGLPRLLVLDECRRRRARRVQQSVETQTDGQRRKALVWWQSVQVPFNDEHL